MSRIHLLQPIDKHLIEVIRIKRFEHNLSQNDLATILGLARGFIGNVETPRNRAKYNLHHINCLAWHFGISPGDFLPQKAFDPQQPPVLKTLTGDI